MEQLGKIVNIAGRQDFDRVVRTVCSPNCLSSCGVNAFVKDDRIVKLEPGYYPSNDFDRICARGIAMATQRLHHPDRLTHPLIRVGKRGGGEFRRATWAEAMDLIVHKMKAVAAQEGWRSNGWMRGSGNYGQRQNLATSRTVHSVGGTIFSHIALTGDAAAPIAYLSALGDFTRSNELSDIRNARYILATGKAIADTGHSEMHRVFDAMENGTKLVVVDPRFSRTATKADEWLSPHPGTDAALVMGMLHVIVTEGLLREDYLCAHTNAPFLVRRDNGKLLRARDLYANGGDAPLVWDRHLRQALVPQSATAVALRACVTVTSKDGMPVECQTGFDASWAEWSTYTPERAHTLCGVSAEQIRHVAREYAAADPAWIWLGFGGTRYHHGHLAARAWITLAAFCGNIGKRYAGVNIVESPGMYMGMGAPDDYVRPGGRVGHSLPATKLLDIIAQENPYPIRSLWMSAIGFGTQTPFFNRFVEESLPKLELLVVTEQMMTPIARHADVVLPCVSYYEDDWDLVASGEAWMVQLRRRAVAPVGESRNDHDIFRDFCERLGLGADWQMSPEDICRHLLKSNKDPRFSSIDWETLRRDHVVEIAIPRPYTPYEDMRFRTPSGRIEIYQEQFIDEGEAVLVHRPLLEGPVDVKVGRQPFMLMTYKHPHFTHSQHSMLPYIREMLPEPRLEISPDDAEPRGIADGALVKVFNERGSFVVRAHVHAGARAGLLTLPQGWSRTDFAQGHPSDLGQIPPNASQERVQAAGGETNYPFWEVRCDVRLH